MDATIPADCAVSTAMSVGSAAFRGLGVPEWEAQPLGKGETTTHELNEAARHAKNCCEL